MKVNIKGFLNNKNTVTIIVVFIGIMALYAVYNWRVNEAITKVKVPYAKKEISSRTQITSEMISYTEMPKKVATSLGIVTNSNQVLGNYVKYGDTIPANSFFYNSFVVKFEEATKNEFSDIEDGYTAYNLDVDINSTYGNSIYTGNYVDLYIKASDDSNKIIFGRLIEGIKVLAVLDNQGNDVFESSQTPRTPAQMWFALPDDLFTLLRKTEYLGGMKVMPIPRNASYSAIEREATIDSQYIENYILSKSITVQNDFVTSTGTTITE